MPEAATESHRTGDARPRSSPLSASRIAWRASLLFAVVCLAHGAWAQSPPSPLPLSNAEDARTLPKGTVMLRALNAWTRYDEVFDATADSLHHLHPLGDAFSAESLGVRQFPRLDTLQKALRTLTGQPSLNLNLGQAFSTADTRVVTTPLSLSYGLTDRLTIGAMVPIVQTHTTVFIELNPQRVATSTGANVGINPARFASNATAQSANGALIDAMRNAANSLNAFLANCSSSGSCSTQTITRATRIRDNDSTFLKAVSFLYGEGTQGNNFVPFGAAQDSVVKQLARLADSVNAVLGSSFAFAPPSGAIAPAALTDLQLLATTGLGVAFDSLGSPDRIGIGDVEVSALFKLLDGFSDTTGGLRLRGTLRAVLRLGTGRPPSGTVPFEVGTGTGQTSADGGAILDVRLGRFVATFAGQYTTYFTSAPVARLPNSDFALFPLDVPVSGTWREGDALQVEATPRIRLTDYFTFHGAYAMRHQAASRYTSPNVNSPPLFLATTEQRAGFGFAYSTVARYARGRSSVPLELFFTHLETLTASGGLTPKYSRDQIEVRIYYRLRRGGR